jgi:hypothetical protein
MKYLKSYKESLDQESIDKDIESLFQSIKDYSRVRIGKVGTSVKDTFVSMNFDNIVSDIDSQIKSEWGEYYRPVKNGDYLSVELSEIFERLLDDERINIKRCEVTWVNAGEWRLTNKDKIGSGPGMLSKVFSNKGKFGPIDGVNKGHYPVEMLPDFLEKKFDRLRQIKLELSFNNINESKEHDDADTMAFYQLFDSEFFIAFEYRDILIKDIKDIKDLIEYYNKTYNENDEWSGGPVNKEFDTYFIDKYKKILGDIFEFDDSKPWKPSFKIIFKTDYGYLPIGFYLTSKKVYTTYGHFGSANTISLEESEKMESDIIRLKKCEVSKKLDTYGNLVISEMISLLSKYRKKDIYDLTNDLNININFDWEWMQ